MHVGKALSADMETRARAEMTDNPRYRWLGELPRWQALRVLARSRLLALSSHMEGGANVLSEALALGVPIVASHIAGSIGILGDDYPGYFPVEDTAALAQLLDKAEGDPLFYRTLSAQCTQRAALIQPWREQQAWQMLLDEVTPCLMTPPMPRNAAHTRLPSAS
jgi:glycosyltransferase involved in cell wall biosynthesis